MINSDSTQCLWSLWLALPVLAMLSNAGVTEAKEFILLYGPADILATADIGAKGDAIMTGSWGEAQKDGQRSFRTYPGKNANTRIAFKAWWREGAGPADAVAAFSFKDSISSPAIVLGYNGAGGQYGYNYAGQFGGANDGQWKMAYVPLCKDVIARQANNTYSILFWAADAVPIERIDIVKANSDLKAEAVSQCRLARQVHVEAMKKVFKELPWTQKTELGEVGSEYAKLGFIPYVRSYNMDIFPGTIPAVQERGAKPLEAYGTPGEFVPIQVAAHALKDATLTASITDLTGPGTLKAGAAPATGQRPDVAVHRIECTAVRAGGGSAVKQWQLQPAWIRTNEPCAVKANSSQAWYVIVHIPADAKSGDYKGSFTIAAADPGPPSGGASRPAITGKVDFPVLVKVLPFSLDKAEHVARGAYISGPLTDDYVQDLADHGINSSSVWESGFAPKLVEGKCTAGVSLAMERYLKALKQAGIGRLVYFGGGDNRYSNPANVPGATGAKLNTPEFEQYYGQFWQDIRRQEKLNGWPEIICCPFDEPVKSEEKMAAYKLCHDIVRKASPQTRLFYVFMNRDWAAKRLGKDADIWSCNGAFGQAQEQKQVLAEQGVKKQFWTYGVCGASGRPGTVRYNAGVGPWKYDADGVYFWAYLWYEADPFNDLDGEFTDWSPAARDVDGVLYDCVAFEGWRQGVNDRLYIETALRMARENKRQDILDRIAQLQKSIASGKESEESTRTRGLDSFFFKIDDANAMDVHRAQAVTMITEMLKK